MSEQGGDAFVVWRVHPSRMVWAGVLWTLVMLSVVGAWLAWLVGPTEARAVRAAVATGIIAAVSLIWWLVLLRPRVELRDEVVVIVNPLATYRLHREDIVAVTDGLHGAEFHRRDGFKIHAVALGDASAGIRRGRLAEVQKALALAGRRIEPVASSLSGRSQRVWHQRFSLRRLRSWLAEIHPGPALSVSVGVSC
nr:hypothetical protein OG781_12435 [Streptomyces sp. NBC_00830]